jgi:uncharacterized protein, PEP-CTERM system associated
VRGLYKVDPALELSASAGYEDNRFFSTRQNGATYGAGIVWHPTDRTNLNATWERRFFGASYHVAFDHRTPLSVWSLNASRDITSYPQQIANLPGGADVNVLLNSLFASRAQDAAQRQLLVDELIRDRGLPLQLSGPLPIFAQQLTLVEAYTATFGILGARNAILFTAYHSRNEPVEGAEAAVSPLLALLSNTTQSGINVAWSHTLAPKLTFVLHGGVSRATDNTGTVGSTRLYALNATLSQSLSALTSAFVGARYQRSLSDQGIGTSYSELAAFVGLTHIFH